MKPNYIERILNSLIGTFLLIGLLAFLASCATPKSVQAKDDRKYNKRHLASFR